MTAPGRASTGYQLDADGFALCEHDTAAGRIDTLAVEASFGNAVPVVDAMPSLMRDGDLTRTTRDGNRVVTFRHRVTAQTPRMLDELGEALIAAVQSTQQLRWQKPAGAASDCYDVVRVQTEKLADEQWDVRERRGVRVYRVSYECLPYVRSDKVSTFTWTGPSAELASMNSTAGWTVVGGGAIASAVGIGSDFSYLYRTTSGAITLRRTVTLDEYLWLAVGEAITDGSMLYTVKIDGVSIPSSKWKRRYIRSAITSYLVPTGAWSGKTVVVEVTISNSSTWSNRATLAGFHSMGYPNLGATDTGQMRPLGIGVIDVDGTARAPCTISFTAPAGGACVYTGPDPNAAIRAKGAGEAVFAKFTVTDDNGTEVSVGSQLMWFPPGDHLTNIGVTDPQPLELNPNGVWPTQASGFADLGDVNGTQWAYPIDVMAAISAFSTSGAKNLISPSPALPQGYRGDAAAHEEHVLHPPRCGFAVMDVNGNPITTTVTYYARWKHNAAQ